MKKILFGCLLILNFKSFAQTKILEVDRKIDTLPKTFGANLKNYLQMYIGYGFVVGQSEKGAAIKYGSSSDFVLGFRYKRKIGNVYSIGYDLNYHRTSFYLVQNSMKIIPDTILHDKEKFVFNAFGLSLYNRFNFDNHRGNYMGYFLDLGAGGDWDFNIKTVSEDKINGNIVTTSTKKLKYVNPYNYYAFTRLGFNKYILSAAYRISDQFIDSLAKVYGSYKNYPELPRIIIGLQIGFY